MRSVRQRPRARASILTTAALTLLAICAPAARAASSDTWTGQGSASASPVGSWGDAGNWSNGVPASGAALIFPRLTSCDAAAFACYTTFAPASSQASSLTIPDDLPYVLGDGVGVSLTLDPASGEEGLSSAPSGAGSGAPEIALPLVLGDSQQWSVAGDGSGSGQLSVNSLSGPSQTLAVDLSAGGQLFFDVHLQTAGLTVIGSGGADPAANGLLGISTPSSAGNGVSPITVQDAALLLGAYSDAAAVGTGPVTVRDGAVTIGGAGAAGPGTVLVNGPLSIDGASTTNIEVDRPGTTPGSDDAQLTATGAITVGGQLSFTDVGGCATPPVGSTFTFLQSSGATLSGEFANLPDGAITSYTAHCAGGTTTRYPIRIGYTSDSVTGTFLAPTPTTSSLTASAASALAGRNVTFTAVVSASGPGAGEPTGPVVFHDGAATIACSTGSALSDTVPDVATCTTQYLAPGTHTISASYGGDGAWAGSASAPVTVIVTPQPTGRKTPRPKPSAGSGRARLGAVKVRGNAVRAVVSCAAGGASCAVRLDLTTAETLHHRTRTVGLGGARVTLKPGRRRIVTVRVNATGRRRLLRRHRLISRLRLEHTVRGQTRTIATRTVTLRLVPRPLPALTP